MTRRALAAILAGACLAVLAPVGAAVAASPTPVVVVASRTVLVPVTVDLQPQLSARGPWGSYAADVWVKGTTGWEQVGSLHGPTPHLSGRVRVNAARTGVGRVTLWVLDQSTGDVQRVAVTLLRRTAVSRPFVEACDGWVYVRATVSHYDPRVGHYMPSKASPVRVQEATPRGWVTVATITTDTRGTVAGYVPVGYGRHLLRLQRLTGATVTAGTSPTVTVETVPGWC